MLCSVEIDELGHELRARRAAAGRTIASVAADAGLSVPYIANLENGRGNPTLAALAALSRALGSDLRIALHDPDPEITARTDPHTGAATHPAADGKPPPARTLAGSTPQLPPSLIAFARTSRFAAEASALEAAGTTAARQRLLAAMAAMAAVSPRPLTDLDWHRVLDTAVLISRPA
jgi:transcriptional regulator with XRE-family HTH domain